jgi:hypothetical protein
MLACTNPGLVVRKPEPTTHTSYWHGRLAVGSASNSSTPRAPAAAWSCPASPLAAIPALPPIGAPHELGSKGSATAWRKTRVCILARDLYACQIKDPTARGSRLKFTTNGPGVIERDSDLESACWPGNRWLGDLTSSQDPEPETRTTW